jgi:hypothetical protein
MGRGTARVFELRALTTSIPPVRKGRNIFRAVTNRFRLNFAAAAIAGTDIPAIFATRTT